MKKKFKPNLQQAIAAYYHFRLSNFVFKSKEQCLDDIQKAVKTKHNGIKSFSAIAGTFFFHWVDGKSTIHNENNWNQMINYEPIKNSR